MEIAIDTEATATPLRRATDLKVHVKMIVEVSRAMNMAATNAMLTAKQAAERSRGAAGVAGHMQRFTRQLDHGLDEMLGHIEQLVQEIATLGQDERLPQYLESLQRLAARRRNDGAPHAQIDVQEDWLALEQALHQALQLLQAAQGIERNANLKQVSGSEMLAGLKQAIDEVNAITQRVWSGVQQFSAEAGAR